MSVLHQRRIFLFAMHSRGWCVNFNLRTAFSTVSSTRSILLSIIWNTADVCNSRNSMYIQAQLSGFSISPLSSPALFELRVSSRRVIEQDNSTDLFPFHESPMRANPALIAGSCKRKTSNWEDTKSPRSGNQTMQNTPSMFHQLFPRLEQSAIRR